MEALKKRRNLKDIRRRKDETCTDHACGREQQAFPFHKLLYRIEGAPMYRRILDKLLKVKKRLEEERSGLAVSITIVTQYEEIGKAGEQEGVKVLYNPHPDEGISSSIKLGIKGNREADACLFTVSDQPWLKEDTIRELAELFLDSGKGMACVSREGKLGNPCIFSGNIFRSFSRSQRYGRQGGARRPPGGRRGPEGKGQTGACGSGPAEGLFGRKK